MASSNSKRSNWRLILRLRSGYEAEAPALFTWIREHIIPACLHAPLSITLVLETPEEDDPAAE